MVSNKLFSAFGEELLILLKFFLFLLWRQCIILVWIDQNSSFTFFLVQPVNIIINPRIHKLRLLQKMALLLQSTQIILKHVLQGCCVVPALEDLLRLKIFDRNIVLFLWQLFFSSATAPFYSQLSAGSTEALSINLKLWEMKSSWPRIF